MHRLPTSPNRRRDADLFSTVGARRAQRIQGEFGNQRIHFKIRSDYNRALLNPRCQSREDK